MTNFLQETDSQSWTKEGESKTSRLHRELNIVKRARSVIPQIENEEVAKQVRKLLLIINVVVNIVEQEVGLDLNNISPLRAHVEEDGSVLIEWIFPDFRIGFNIEPNPDDSGWHLVSSKKLGDAIASGLLTDMVGVVIQLIEYILPNT